MDISTLPPNKIVLFDGECGFCSSTVQLIIKYDKKDSFRFCSLQSEVGQAILQHLHINPEENQSVILFQRGVAYYKEAEAVLAIVHDLSGWPQLFSICKLFPSWFNQSLYKLIAKNRHLLSSKKRCELKNHADKML